MKSEIKLTKANGRNIEKAAKKFGCLGGDIAAKCLVHYLADYSSQASALRVHAPLQAP